MNRETQVGLALAILLIGIVGAVFLRHDITNPTDNSNDRSDPPVQDSRSESERPPASTNSPRRAHTNDDPPRVTSAPRPSLAPVDPEPDNTPSPSTNTGLQPLPQPQPGRGTPPRTASRPVRVSGASGEPPAPPLPSTRPTSTPPAATRQRSRPPSGRQPGTPPTGRSGDLDRAPHQLRFLPSRHPLAGRRAIRPDR